MNGAPADMFKKTLSVFFFIIGEWLCESLLTNYVQYALHACLPAATSLAGVKWGPLSLAVAARASIGITGTTARGYPEYPRHGFQEGDLISNPASNSSKALGPGIHAN